MKKKDASLEDGVNQTPPPYFGFPVIKGVIVMASEQNTATDKVDTRKGRLIKGLLALVSETTNMST